MRNSYLVLAAAFLVAACASGSALVTGVQRPSLEDHNQVVVLREMPEGAEEIAIVRASSDSGWTEQGSLDYAIDELKRQAAKVGANAVVITARDSETSVVGVPVYGGGTSVSSSVAQVVEGLAVWVEPDSP